VRACPADPEAPTVHLSSPCALRHPWDPSPFSKRSRSILRREDEPSRPSNFQLAILLGRLDPSVPTLSKSNKSRQYLPLAGVLAHTSPYTFHDRPPFTSFVPLLTYRLFPLTRDPFASTHASPLILSSYLTITDPPSAPLFLADDGQPRARTRRA
jgi:hypothetical protein